MRHEELKAHGSPKSERALFRDLAGRGAEESLDQPLQKKQDGSKKNQERNKLRERSFRSAGQ